jgi:hypothetical protein
MDITIYNGIVFGLFIGIYLLICVIITKLQSRIKVKTWGE